MKMSADFVKERLNCLVEQAHCTDSTEKDEAFLLHHLTGRDTADATLVFSKLFRFLDTRELKRLDLAVVARCFEEKEEPLKDLRSN